MKNDTFQIDGGRAGAKAVAMTAPPSGAATTIDIGAYASALRWFWHALRAFTLPAVLAMLGNVLFLIAVALGDRSRLPFLLGLWSRIERQPSFAVMLVAAVTSWALIGRHGKSIPTFLFTCLALMSQVIFSQGYLLSVLLPGSGTRPPDPSGSSIAAWLALFWNLLLPWCTMAIAAVQLVRIQLGRDLQGREERAMQGFRRLVHERRQSFQTFAPRRLPWIVAVGIGLGGSLVAWFMLLEVVTYDLLGAQRDDRPFGLSSQFGPERPLQYFAFNAVHVVFLIGLVATIAWWVRFGARIVRRRATDVLADPDYRPVVFLRSFRDEDSRVRSKNPFWATIWRRVRVEEVVASQLMRLGPCVAIGKPGEWMPRYGAMRAYFADADWQTAIRTWTDRAVLSVVMAGASPSVLWELQHLIATDRMSSLLVILPPDPSRQARAARWQAVCGVFAGTRWERGMASAAIDDALCVTFGSDGSVVTVAGWGRHQVDYDVAVQVAAVRLLGHDREAVGSPGSMPAPDHRH